MIAAPVRLSTVSSTFEAEFKARLHWSAQADAQIEQRAADILADVQQRGDAAVLDYTARFDGVQAASMAALELTQTEFKAAFESIPAAQRLALQKVAGLDAAANLQTLSAREFDVFCLLAQGRTDAPGTAVGGDFGGAEPAAIDVTKEIIAGLQRAVHAARCCRCRRGRRCGFDRMYR